ncbi:MAG: DegQ family serine endoprotease [Hydrogenovibrio sp.]|uniref:DegQ family serine endoprotease n=1 Tax=Hydrogenovibrio TaxID=28884 RepID=UPI000374E79A|nr:MULTISPECIES: DegQ family serine endoprotease [Hydrogenovibrio]MDR9499455.1 DegQ family serine endoprotease [Hydrogenovibrio sp.]
MIKSNAAMGPSPKAAHFIKVAANGLVLLLVLMTLNLAQAQAKPPTEGTAAQGAPGMMLPDFSKLARDHSPTVVNISTTREVEQRVPPQFRGLPDEMLRHFFGMPGQGQGEGDERPSRKESSLGSGFIISEDGFIVTNHHVIDGADDIVVKLSDRREMAAEVVGSDKRSDIALLKIDAEGLPVADIGTAKNLQVGQWVLAIGEPFGLDYSVTHGIVSALGRTLPNDTYVPFIQTDVPINPGNSGGPLLNTAGEVVGVNAQIFSNSGGSMGLSFSIPIDIAMNVVKQLKENGKVVRGFLGVGIQEVSGDLAESFGMERPMGALVNSISPDSAAEAAGVEPGDVILSFAGKTIDKSGDLPPVVGSSPVGEPLQMTILRNGERQKLTVELKALGDMAVAERRQAPESEGPDRNDALGVAVEAVPEEALAQRDLPFGVGISDVKHGGPAYNAGMKPGDILVTINFQPVKTVAQFNQLMENMPKGRSIPIRIVRGKRSMFLPVVLE